MQNNWRNARRFHLLTFAAAFIAVVPMAKAAQSPEVVEKYRDCLARVEKDPQQAFEFAITWRDEGGGAPAHHCVAMALLEQGHIEEAALRLEKLALRPDAGGKAERAEILAQAGHAWLLAERPVEADVDFTSAIELTPNNPRPYLDRAQASHLRGLWDNVIVDTTKAIGLNRQFVDAYVLRASARRSKGDLSGAANDIERALDLDPQNLGAALERGELLQLGAKIERAQ